MGFSAGAARNEWMRKRRIDHGSLVSLVKALSEWPQVDASAGLYMACHWAAWTSNLDMSKNRSPEGSSPRSYMIGG
jgi:hypothetical protein